MEFKTSLPFLATAGNGDMSAYLLVAYGLLYLAGCIQGATFAFLFRAMLTSVVARLKAAYRAAAPLRQSGSQTRD
ncbi:hypothetical protein [Amycolatopsis thailandensis]|uniref:hypothetical protein n=1 Tax=Amycolatopsis thailandensis TaxID=589330 RepID=UPI00362ACE26